MHTCITKSCVHLILVIYVVYARFAAFGHLTCKSCQFAAHTVVKRVVNPDLKQQQQLQSGASTAKAERCARRF